ncbi:MAG TPA: hypothetical protein VLC93_14460 [Myxococcota bacterium]|nr:hypothetical protein [Myxococcota bacterium]
MTDDNQQPSDGQQGESFGFQAQGKNEKYNTEFLVNNLEKDKQRTKYIVIGVIVAVVGLCGILFALAGGESEGLKPKTVEQARAEAAAKAEAAKPADTAKPAEAPKP